MVTHCQQRKNKLALKTYIPVTFHPVTLAKLGVYCLKDEKVVRCTIFI